MGTRRFQQQQHQQQQMYYCAGRRRSLTLLLFAVMAGTFRFNNLYRVQELIATKRTTMANVSSSSSSSSSSSRTAQSVRNTIPAEADAYAAFADDDDDDGPSFRKTTITDDDDAEAYDAADDDDAYADADNKKEANSEPKQQQQQDASSRTGSSSKNTVLRKKSSASETGKQPQAVVATKEGKSTPSSTLSSISTKLPLCTSRQISEGEWVPLTLDEPPYIPIRREDRCYPLETYQARPFHTWEWLPHDANAQQLRAKTCEFSPWNTDTFCQLMQHETILFMGDSLTAEHYNAFCELLQLRKPVPRNGPFANLTAEEYHNTTLFPKHRPSYHSHACNGTVQIVLGRNDELAPDVVERLIQHFQPTVLVLNRGAHYQPDPVLLSHVENDYIPLLHRWQDNCRQGRRKSQKSKTCQLIWRTSVPGTPNCQDYTQPDNNLTALEYLVNQTRNRFRWELFKHQNALIRQAFEKQATSKTTTTNTTGNTTADHDHAHNPLVVDVFDAYPIGIRRPDGHCAAYLDKNTDCLHGCLGSRIDVWSQAILHFIQMRQQQEHQQEPLTGPISSNNNNNVATSVL